MIIGITGTNGAGKGTVVEYLKQRGFKHLSVGDFLLEEIYKEKPKEQVTRLDQIEMGNRLRTLYGPDYIAQTLLARALMDRGDFVIESIRNTKEVEFLKNSGKAVIWAVDAEISLRYERITKYRKEFKDKTSFEEFAAQEKIEFSNPEPHKQNLNKCIEMANQVLLNNGTKQELYNQIDRFFINKERET